MVMQLEPGVEIVIMDNASSDNATEVVTQYLLRHPEARYFRKQENTDFNRVTMMRALSMKKGNTAG